MEGRFVPTAAWFGDFGLRKGAGTLGQHPELCIQGFRETEDMRLPARCSVASLLVHVGMRFFVCN